MNRAFSLVELSIVLVILGLLTGGILAGQNLIQAAEMRAITTKYQSYAAATNTFRDKYFAIPGDMANAYDFWGTNCSTSADPLICNGDGNGEISDTNTTESREETNAWQHLALAGLIEGNHTGINALSAPTHHYFDDIPGESYPRSPYKNSFFNFNGKDSSGYCGSTPANTSSPQCNQYIMSVSGPYTAYSINFNTGGPIMTPANAWNIDVKMDDGEPMKGKIRMTNFNVHGYAYCYNFILATSSHIYNLDETDAACAMSFIH